MSKRSVYYMHVHGSSFRPRDFSESFHDDIPAGNICISLEKSKPYDMMIVDDILDTNADRHLNTVPVDINAQYDDVIVFDNFDSMRNGIKHVVQSTAEAGCLDSAGFVVHNTEFNDDEKQLLKHDAITLSCDYSETDAVYKSPETTGLSDYDKLMAMARERGYISSSDLKSGPDII